MRPRDRQSEILRLVRRDGEATVDDLAEGFGVSRETIRRDLDALASTGALHRVKGGARQLRLATEGSYRERLADNAAAKEEIGRKLAALIRPGDTLFMDTGTTTLACAESLADRAPVTVITNALDVARRLGEAGHRVFLLGGAYGAANAQTVGPMVIEQVGRFQADHAVLTVAAVEATGGAMDADPEEAQVARAMASHARNRIILAHGEKFDRHAAFRVCRLAEIDVLVSERRPAGALAEALTEAGVTLA